MKKIIIPLAIFMIVASGCASSKKIAGSINFDTECLDVALDGTETLKAWGLGRDRAEAIEQAKKNGIRDVLFKGITKGKPDCNMKPVINEVNVQEKNEAYFNRFFGDGGVYGEFISMKDEPQTRWKKKDRKRADKQVQFDVVINVNRAKLVKRMTTDRILKP